MPKLVPSLKILAHKFVLEHAPDVVTAARNENIILGACSFKSSADTIMLIRNLILISLLLFSTKKMSLNFWNGRNIKHCILRKEVQIEEHLCPVISSNNNNHYNDRINTWTTETSFLELYGNAWFQECTWSIRNFQENLLASLWSQKNNEIT